ncbi:MAG: SDR family NAD(P)-dependent oxidoreductase [Microthrixaceae bacterium]
MSLPTPSPTTTALVTGTSSGIGVEIARGLVRRGHGVTLLARRTDRLEELATDLRRQGVRVEVLARDLADAAGRATIADELAERGLAVSVLVNNAGISTLGPVHRSDPAEELRMVEVDVAAVVDLCSRFVPGMVERGAGAVLNVASTASFQPLPGQAGYGASKAFVRSYTEALAVELRGTGVHATVLCPGPVETEFGDVAGFDADATKETLPSFMWETPQAVADVGLHALAAGRTVAIPGPANRVLAMASYLTPKRLLLPLLASQHPGLKD